MVELVKELSGVFGSNSAIVKEVARQVAPQVSAAWLEPGAEAANVDIRIGQVEITGPLTFLADAKQRLAQFNAR
jgi:hypothetical protein